MGTPVSVSEWYDPDEFLEDPDEPDWDKPPDPDKTLWHALGYGLGLSGLESVDPFSLRQYVADFIAGHPEHHVDCMGNFLRLGEFIPQLMHRTLQGYANDIIQGRERGGPLELNIFCQLFQVDVLILRKDSSSPNGLKLFDVYPEVSRYPEMLKRRPNLHKPRAKIHILWFDGSNFLPLSSGPLKPELFARRHVNILAAALICLFVGSGVTFAMLRVCCDAFWQEETPGYMQLLSS